VSLINVGKYIEKLGININEKLCSTCQTHISHTILTISPFEFVELLSLTRTRIFLREFPRSPTDVYRLSFSLSLSLFFSARRAKNKRLAALWTATCGRSCTEIKRKRPRRADAFIIRRFNLSDASRPVTVAGVN